MPKLIKNIANFTGGLNNNTNRRDILDVESQVLLNVSNEIPGKLVMEGRSIASSISSNDVTAIDALNYGNGLLHTNLDRNFGAAGINETEYLFINDKTDSIVRIPISIVSRYPMTARLSTNPTIPNILPNPKSIKIAPIFFSSNILFIMSSYNIN